jgi:hypothetical protein
VANAELLATSGQKVESENHLQRELRGSLQRSKKRLRSGDTSMQPLKARTCSNKALADCREAVLDAKQEGIHKPKALQELAKITADTVQADHQAKIEEQRQVLAAETISQLVTRTS